LFKELAAVSLTDATRVYSKQSTSSIHFNHSRNGM